MSKLVECPANFPSYSLPKLYNWHSRVKGTSKEKGKVFKYFGQNWWDLLCSNRLDLKKGSITINTKNAHAIIFINLGKTAVKMTNTNTEDVYNVQPGKRSTVNNTDNKTCTFISSNNDNEIDVTRIGSMYIVLLQIEQIKDGTSNIKNTALFDDFLLMSGVPDREQFTTTLGIENFGYMDIVGWKNHGDKTMIKSDWIDLLLDQWKVCNPKKLKYTKNPIPKKVHWIWLRVDIKKKEFGDLKKRFYKFMDTWYNRNPDFEFNLWTDNPNFFIPKQYKNRIVIRGPHEVKKLINSLPNTENVRRNIYYLFNNHPNVGARSDTLRQVILYQIGGIYADVNDAACLAPLENMFKRFDYIIGVEPVLYVNNAIIASAKRHIISKNMIAYLADYARSFVQEWIDDYTDAEQGERDDYIVSTTGPIAMTSVIFGILEKRSSKGLLPHTLILPSSWVYPNYFIAESPDVWMKPISILSHFDARDYLK